MNDQILQDILRRLQRLEQTTVRYRAGEVTGTAPLDVALGGSDVAYEDVKAINGLALEVGDQVATLLWGNDLLVLGKLGDGAAWGRGTDLLTFSASATSATKTVTHGLEVAPTSVVAIADVSSDFIIIDTVAASINATTFQVAGRTQGGGALTATPRFYWFAAA